jgi:glycosyltransferase involved in cell wall biosynthesis
VGRHAVYIVALATDEASDTARTKARRPTVALLPWADIFSDFLDRLGVSFEELRDEFTGSWMFGYASALATAGVRTVLVCPTSRVREPVAAVHRPTGADLRLLPAFRLHGVLRAHALDGRLDGRIDPRLVARAAASHVAPYLATPPVALARTLRRERVDAVLCQEYEDPRFDVCVAVGRLARVPVFGVFQGADYQLSKLERPLRPLAIRGSAGLVVGAQRELERVRETYGVASARLARILNPIDVTAWRPGERARARDELGIPVTARVVAWHGQVQLWRKGLDVLLEAWKRVAEARPGRDLRLLLVGAGEDVDEVRRRVDELSLADVLILDGWVSDRDRLRGLLSASDLYVFPSRHEGLPVAPLEALACGIPVVGADASGVRDVVGEAGIVVPRDDPHSLALALGELLDDDERRLELGMRARARAEGHFSLESVGQQLRRFLIDRRPP